MIETKDMFMVAGPTTTGRPYLNEGQLGGSLSTSSTFLADKKTLMNWIKRTPEAIGILRQIAMDTITQLNFVSVEEKSMGRPSDKKGKENVTKAERFSKVNFLKQQLRAAVVEGVALGDSYLWKGKLNESQLKEVAKKLSKFYNLQIDSKAIDEDYVGQKTIQYVASSSMYIKLDESGTKIESFIQRTSQGFGNATFPTATLNRTQEGATFGGTREWKPEQIIHYRFMEIDGKVHGYTPMQADFPIIKTLGAIKDYHGNYFESGPAPDLIFNFEEMDANSPELVKMSQIIQTWYNNKRRGHLVTSSKFSVEEVNKWNKDMEFRMLAIYYTGVIAFSLGMPLEKIRAILGGEIKSTTGGSDISNTDYQRNIFDMQDDWEDLLNTQFFNEEFGVDMKLARTAARDEVAEVMRDQQKINIVEKMQQMDLIKKDKVSSLVERMFPDIPSEWFNPNPSPKVQMDGQIPSSKIIPGQGKQALSEEKRQQQQSQQKFRPPTGTKELFEIDFARFTEEIMQHRITPEGKNKIEMEDGGKNISLYLTPYDLNKTFVTVIPKSQFSKVKQFFIEPLSKPAKRVN